MRIIRSASGSAGTDRVLEAAGPQLASIEAAAALAASLRRRCDGDTVPPALAVRLDAVLDALGVRDIVEALDEHEAATLLAVIESRLVHAIDLVTAPDRAGWCYTDRRILLAQGRTSALLAPIFRRSVVPLLGGDLAARLEEEGASFLDVGTGVGALAIALCQLWPALRVVGVDRWEPALALARENVAAAGLAARVELRQMPAESLTDADEHDLAWIPTFFVSGSVIEVLIERVRIALRSGGWAIFGLYVRSDEPLASALAKLRTARHGGLLHTPQELAVLVTRAGFADVDLLVDVGSPHVFVVGRAA